MSATVVFLFLLHRILIGVLMHTGSNIEEIHHDIYQMKTIDSNWILSNFQLNLSNNKKAIYSEDYYNITSQKRKFFGIIFVSSTDDVLNTLKSKNWSVDIENKKIQEKISNVNKFISYNRYKIPQNNEPYIIFNYEKKNKAFVSVYSVSSSLLYFFAEIK